MSRKQPRWKRLEDELVKATSGKAVRAWRRGEYADVRTPNCLFEAKWSSDGELRIRGAYCVRVIRLADRLGLYPVLVAGTGDVRVLCPLGGRPEGGIDKELRRVLQYWLEAGMRVFVVPRAEAEAWAGGLGERCVVGGLAGFAVRGGHAISRDNG